MKIVYIETTIVSYLVANPTRNLIAAGRQQTTRDWWQFRQGLYQCVTSDETLAQTDYLLTCNCRHLANEQILRRLARGAEHSGWKLPRVCTPLELMID